jgi:hypothetical protein
MYDLAPLCDHRASKGAVVRDWGLDSGSVQPVIIGWWGREECPTVEDVIQPFIGHE